MMSGDVRSKDEEVWAKVDRCRESVMMTVRLIRVSGS